MPSHYAYSGVFNHAAESSKDLRPINYTSGSFLDIQERWSATEKEAFAVYQSVLKFDLHLRWAKCILCCDHKPLESFLSQGLKIPNCNRWSMELADYNTLFVHIKGKNNVLVDAVSRLKTLIIYKEPLGNPKTPVVSSMQGNLMEICTTDMHTVSTTMLYTDQKCNITCRKLLSQLHHGNKSSFKSAIMSEIRSYKKYIHGIKHDVTIAPWSLVLMILHEFHDCKGHQGTIHMFEATRRSYWCPKLWQDIVKYKGKCSLCAKHLPNMAKYPQHLEILQFPMEVLAIDTIGHLPITSKGARWALTVIFLHMSYVFAILMKENQLKMSIKLICLV